MAKLTEKQKRFADEYLIDLNATQAAIRAKYSAKTAEAAAARLLRNVKVAAYITERQQKRQSRTEITQDKVLRELSYIAFSNAADYAQVNENVVEISATDELDEQKQRAIAGIKQTQTGVEVKLHDKVKALELVGKHLGMFVDRLSLDGDLDFNIKIDYGEDDGEDNPI